MLKPLKRKKLHESITEEVLRFIEEKGHKTGDRLPPERFFCDEFQISRASFREAMKKLESFGVIEIRPGSGMYLKAEKTLLGEVTNFKLHVSMEKKAIQELLDLREIMEMYAMEQILLHQPAGIMEELGRIIEDYDAKRAEGGIPRQEDLQFHRLLYAGSGNRLLSNMFASIKDMEGLWEEKVINSVEGSIFGRETEPLHRKIYDSLREGDLKTAKKYMQKHFEIMRRDLNDFEQGLFP